MRPDESFLLSRLKSLRYASFKMICAFFARHSAYFNQRRPQTGVFGLQSFDFGRSSAGHVVQWIVAWRFDFRCARRCIALQLSNKVVCHRIARAV
jgi:hypothetical protein